MGSRGSTEWSCGVILVVHEGHPWGPGGHLRGVGGSSWWSMRVIRGVQGVILGVLGVILVVHEGRPWVPGGHLSGPGGSSRWSMRVVRGVQGVI